MHPDATARQKCCCFGVRSVVLFAIGVPDPLTTRDGLVFHIVGTNVGTKKYLRLKRHIFQYVTVIIGGEGDVLFYRLMR